MRDGLATPPALERESTGFDGIGKLAQGIAALAPMMRERADAIGATRVHLLDPFRHEAVHGDARRRLEVAEQLVAQLVVHEAPFAFDRLQHSGRSAPDGPAFEIQARVDVAHERQIDGATDDGRGLEAGPVLRRGPLQPATQHALHAAGDHVGGKREVADALESARRLGEHPNGLDDEERQSFGLALQERQELRSPPTRAEHALPEGRDVDGVEAAEAHRRHVGKASSQVRSLLVAIAPEQDDRPFRHRAGEPAEERDTLAPGPLQVLEDHQDELALRAQERLDGHRQLQLRRCALQHRRQRDRTPDEVVDVDDDPLQHAVQRVAAVTPEHQTPQRLAPDLVGPARTVDRMAAHHDHPGYEGARAELLEQPRLADTALSAHEPGTAAAARGVLQDGGERPELVTPVHERRRPDQALARGDRLGRQRVTERLLKRQHHLGRVGVALGGILGEQARQHAAQRRIELVLGFEIAVDDPVTVQVEEGAQQLHDQIGLHRRRDPAGGLGDRVRPLLQIHRQIRLAIGVEPVVERADDVRVAERREDLKLLSQRETRRLERLAVQMQPQPLQRDGSARQPVESPEHHPEPSLPQSIQDLVAPADQLGARRLDVEGH